MTGYKISSTNIIISRGEAALVPSDMLDLPHDARPMLGALRVILPTRATTHAHTNMVLLVLWLLWGSNDAPRSDFKSFSASFIPSVLGIEYLPSRTNGFCLKNRTRGAAQCISRGKCGLALLKSAPDEWYRLSEVSDATIAPLNQSSNFSVEASNHIFISGWVDQPNNRGTIDIIWSCLATIFLCTWTVLCLNIPAESDSQLMFLGRKFRWMILAIIVPEFLLGFAAGQFENAYKAVDAFKDLGFPDWTMQQAFFAEMGGFVLHPKDSTPFPVNNRHIQWLVVNGFMEMPQVTTRNIWDRSKADHLIKSIVCVQICWLMITVIARAIQKLAITTLELGTVSIVFCTVATFFCWLQKPADVRTPIDLHIASSSADLLIAGGDAASKPYRMTPLDFVDNLGPSYSQNCAAFVGVRSGPQQRPLPRFTNDRFPHVRGLRQILLITITLFSDGIHIFGWNFQFPTRAERIVWRVAGLQMFITAACWWGAEFFAGLYRDHTWNLLWTMLAHPSRVKNLKKARAERPPRAQPTPETFPLPWECGFGVLMWVLYLAARAYVLVEMFAGLRVQPVSAYVCINWSTFVPHV